MFDKISAESRRVQGQVLGNTEVIKGIRNIVDKDQYFSDVLKINKDLNTHKLRISMTPDGNVNLNAQYKFHPSELNNLGKEGRNQLFSTLGSDTLTFKNVPTRLAVNPTAVGKYIDNEEEANILVGVRAGEIIRIGTFLIRVSNSGAENISDLLHNLSEEIYSNVMTVSFNLLSNLLPEEIAKLRLLSPEVDLVHQIVDFVFQYMKHERPFGEASRENDTGLVVVLKEFFQEGKVNRDTILYLREKLMAWVDEQIDKRRLQYPHKKQIICTVCEGIRYA